MALLSIAEAAHLARKSHAELYHDIDDGRLQARRASDGELLLDTEELWRVYGSKGNEIAARPDEQMRIAVLEERQRALERALALEAELRKAKDQIANELRARLADKDNLIKALESKILFLEYDRQVEALPLEDATSAPPREHDEDAPPPAGQAAPRGHWWSRLLGARRAASVRKTS